MRGFLDGLDENAPPEIKEDVSVIVQWFGEVMDKYEDDPDAQLSPDDISDEVKEAQTNFQTYIEKNCSRFSPEPDAF